MVQRVPQDKKTRILELRRQGLTYAEIQKLFPVSKSTLSMWLKDIKIPEAQKRKHLRKRLQTLLKISREKKIRKMHETQKIYEDAMKNIREISKRELWLMGVILYWAAGPKNKEKRSGLGVRLTSSNPCLIRFFTEWLLKVGNIKKEEIMFDLYLHENRRKEINKIIKHWADATGFSAARFNHIYFQKYKLKNQNYSGHYFGLMRIRVKASSLLARQIYGWIKGIKKYYWGIK